MIILSFDVGQKSLGFCALECAAGETRITRMEVYDIAPGKKLKEISLVEMTRNLKDILDDLAENFSPDKVLIEKQFQFKGNCSVMAQLVLHYIAIDVELVDPRRKNSFEVEGINYKEILAKCATRYAANKKYSVAAITKLYPDSLAGVKRSKWKDCCDAALQALAWIRDMESPA